MTRPQLLAYIVLPCTACVGLHAGVAHGGVEVYVATDGSDANSGTKDKPFGSLEAARDELRRLKRTGGLNGAATVWIRGGVYCRTKTFELTQDDSGTEKAPIVYRAYATDRPRLVGGREIPASWCGPVADAGILQRLDESVRGKVVQAELKAHGISEYGELSVSGAMLELFCDGRRLSPARWPNEGWEHIGKVVEVGSDATRKLVDESGKANTFEYVGDRPKRWVGVPDVVLHGFWFYGWADDQAKIERVDAEKHEIILAGAPRAIKKDQWFCALNLPEEMDRPGEWYLDRRTGVLYFLPPKEFPGMPLWCSLLTEPLIALNNASHVTLRGLTLEVTRGTAVVVSGGTQNLVAGCVIRGIGSDAVAVGGGTKNGIVGCDIHDVGTTGVRLTGGDRSTLTPAGNYAVNNHIHHYAQRKMVYQPAVAMSGVGHRAAHNLVHDAPHQAMAYDGNDHVIELNEIHDVVLDSSDAGVLYTGRDWTWRGNVVRHNFFHHIPHRPGYGSKVVYLDDCVSSTEIFGNVFYNTRESAFIGGGRDNVVQNNIFVECDRPVCLDSRGLTWEYFKPEGPMYASLRAVPYDKPPWSTRYPALARILQEHPQAPLGNVVADNVSVRSTWRDPDRKYVRIADNLVTEDDPGFVDAAHMDFRLKDDSIVYRKIPAFKKIPFDKIGPYRDEYRATWPCKDGASSRPSAR